MMVALLHSSTGNRDSAEIFLQQMKQLENGGNDSESEPLIPHQIRGFLSSFTSVLPSTPSFKNCSACSDAIVLAYDADGDVEARKSFLDDVCSLDGPTFISELCGIGELSSQLEDFYVDFDEDDE